MSPAGRGARLPGEAPQPFCERCGRSVDAATIGLRVGLCHCPSCDLFACRSCWSEAAESCPECGTSFAAASTAEMHSEALAAGVLAANALRGEGPAAEEPVAWPEEPAPWAEEPAAWAAVPGVWAGVPAEPPATITSLPPTMRWKTRGVPIGIGTAVVAAALFALVLGNPFGAGRVESAINPTSTPSGSSRVGDPAGVGVPSPGAEGTPTVDGPTDPTDPTATGRGRPAAQRSCADPATDRRRDARTRSDGHAHTSNDGTGSDADAQASRNASSDPDPCPDADAEPARRPRRRSPARLPDRAESRRPDRREGPRHVDGRRFQRGRSRPSEGPGQPASSRRRAGRPVPACRPAPRSP